MTIVASLVTGVLLLLSGLHVSWAVGGIPSRAPVGADVHGRPAFVPTRLATLAVALALAALVVVTRAGLWGASPLPARLAYWGTWVLAAVFVGRAVGDFRLVGFAKRVRDTAFARWDTRLYSPLCAGLGLATLWIALG